MIFNDFHRVYGQSRVQDRIYDLMMVASKLCVGLA